MAVSEVQAVSIVLYLDHAGQPRSAEVVQGLFDELERIRLDLDTLMELLVYPEGDGWMARVGRGPAEVERHGMYHEAVIAVRKSLNLEV